MPGVINKYFQLSRNTKYLCQSTNDIEMIVIEGDLPMLSKNWTEKNEAHLVSLFI